MGKFRNMITLKDPEPENEQIGFGASVAIHNGYVVVGNYNGESPDTGSVHVFKKSGMGFSYLQTLAVLDGENGDLFGISVAIHDGYIVVGDFGDNDFSGSVYVYRLERGEFRFLQKIPNPDINESQFDYFGWNVAISDGYIVVGAYGDNNSSGSVYVYRLERGEFKYLQHIPNPDTTSPGSDTFGRSVAISDGYIVVGAYYDDPDFSGSFYVYSLERGKFRLFQHISNPDTASPDGDNFGISVSIHDGYIIIGALNDKNTESGNIDKEGSVYIYRLERGEFRLFQKIKNPDIGSQDNDRFGYSVVISDGYIIVGANGDDSQSGSVYVYRLERGEFRYIQHIPNPDIESLENDQFGTSVSIHNGRIVVGAPETSSTNIPGTAYIFSYGY